MGGMFAVPRRASCTVRSRVPRRSALRHAARGVLEGAAVPTPPRGRLLPPRPRADLGRPASRLRVWRSRRQRAYDGRHPAPGARARRGPTVAAPLRRRGRPAPGARRHLPAPHGQDAAAGRQRCQLRGRVRRLLRRGADHRRDQGRVRAAPTASCSTSTTSTRSCARRSGGAACRRRAYVLPLPRPAVPLDAGGGAPRVRRVSPAAVPEVNDEVEIAPGVELTPDLWFDGLRAGGRSTRAASTRRTAASTTPTSTVRPAYRRHDVPYELVTKERLRSPKDDRAGWSTPLLVSGATTGRRRTSGRSGTPCSSRCRRRPARAA